MADEKKNRVLIIGAGAMGIAAGYHLSLAGAQITYLIRPHRVGALDHPQALYCYDDNELKEFKAFSYITDPSEITNASYDFILITLDGAALQHEAGLALIETISQAVRGKDTKVLIGSVFVNSRPWFIEKSGLPKEQVTNAYLGTQIYAPSLADIPAHPPADKDLVARADFAYTEALGWGILAEADGSSAAASFADLYNRCGPS